MKDFYFAATLTEMYRPLILCHGTEKGDVAMRGLAKMAQMRYNQTSNVFAVGTLEDLIRALGVGVRKAVRDYLYGIVNSRGGMLA